MIKERRYYFRKSVDSESVLCYNKARVKRQIMFPIYIYPPVAKLDIAADSDSEGRGFESLRADHKRGKRLYDACRVLFFCHFPVRVSAKKVHDNSADRLDGFVNRRVDSFTSYIREFLISSGSYVILSMNERSVKLEMNN